MGRKDGAVTLSWMCGAPWGPIPDKHDQHIPVDIADNGDHMRPDRANAQVTAEKVDDEEDGKEFRSNVDKFHISREAIKTNGDIAGCSACIATRPRGYRPGRLGHNRSVECRQRIMEVMERNFEYRHLTHRQQEANGGRANDVGAHVGHVDGGMERPENKQQVWPHVRNVIAHVYERMQRDKAGDSVGTTNDLGTQDYVPTCWPIRCKWQTYTV